MRGVRSVLVVMVVLLAGVSIAPGLAAPVPAVFPVTVTASTLAVSTTPYRFTFALFDVASGGTRLWSESKTYRLPLSKKITHQLGSVNPAGNPISPALFDRQLWVEASVGARKFARVRLGVVPYAVRSELAGTIEGQVAAGQIDATGAAAGAVLTAGGDATASWQPAAGGGGTVTQIATGPGLTGGPVTGTGMISVATGGIAEAMIADGAVTNAKITGPISASKLEVGTAAGTVAAGDHAHAGMGDITAVSTAPGSGLTGGAGFGDAALSVDTATIQARVGGTCAPGSSIRVIGADGAVTCEVDDSAEGSTWSLAGNSGTNPGINFIGTTDAVPLELRVDNQRALRLERATTRVGISTYTGLNVVGGDAGNVVTPGVTLATIAGGGGTVDGTAVPNRVTDAGGTVSGGWDNQAGDGGGTLDDRGLSTVGGGASNMASGGTATVAGGSGNTAAGNYSAVGGGLANHATGSYATVSGGGGNTAGGDHAVVPGGGGNVAGGYGSFAAGLHALVRTPVESGDADGDAGTFVWHDASAGSFQSTGDNQFLVYAAGGVGINKNNPSHALDVEGTVAANSTSGNGVQGVSYAPDAIGVLGESVGGGYGSGVMGRAWGVGTAIRGDNPGPGFAGMFLGKVYVGGDLEVSGTLIKGGGSFKIDHPLDPRNRYLSHSFVESPDMMNIYNGNVTTDGRGYATIELPAWFGALNRDFRYQLTVIGQFAQAIVARKIEDNRFTIRTDKPGIEVSWQVTGIRQDPYANEHRIPVEEDKPVAERGKCLHAEACGEQLAQGQ